MERLLYQKMKTLLELVNKNVSNISGGTHIICLIEPSYQNQNILSQDVRWQQNIIGNQLCLQKYLSSKGLLKGLG